MVYLVFAVGLVLLFLGGEVLIRGAVALARRFHLSPLVIGVTIVGFGTSTPELLVALQSALAGAPALALGNVIGSNIANILLILGLAALIMPVPLPLNVMRRDFAVMIGATLMLWAMLAGGVLARWEGAVLVAGLVAYLWISLRGAKPAAATTVNVELPPAMALWRALLLTLAGLGALMLGARLLVGSATLIARDFGVSEAVIGLTVLAVGTSLPELATAILAALRRHPEIAVGNILGSNVFNILGILGITALVTPIPVEPRFAGFDIGLALAAALSFLAFAALPARVGRIAGGGYLVSYLGYVLWLGLG
ncbi:MAG: sodium:calcium antiporter [Alphaproteobacteria bacterium HGW-Alphaproteobacteria-6]|nr:MAG: sodium:calcium antiporter [Alphaproteobacteria bacterium HGW-Alphaproteobacteria-6]